MEPQRHNSHQPSVSATRLAPSKEWVRAGFFGAFGVALMALLAEIAKQFYEAVLVVALPFVLGAALAWMLDPLAARLTRRGMRRIAAAGLVFGALLLLFAGIGILVVPAVAKQATNLAANIPEYTGYLKNHVNSFLKTHHLIAGIKLPKNFTELSNQMSARISTTLQNSFGSIGTMLVSSVTLIGELILALIITFFLLVDLDRLRARVLYLAPEGWRGTMRQLGGDVGGVFADYIRGLAIVCSLYGSAMIVMLYAMSIFHHDLAKFALIVGISSGVLYLVPYIGSAASAVLTFTVAAIAGGPIFGGIAVGLSIVINQIFDNIVTPKVVGGGVGLHPVVSIFALVLGGVLFGVWGMLLSVPIAASVQIVLFHLFPKLTTPTPPDILQAENQPVPSQEAAAIDV